MAPGHYSFGRFMLDAGERRLSREGAPIEINARYLDALILLVSEAGNLITKDRFHNDVWRGVPVTDDALTQCITTLRRQLGDDAARPQFIVTVPKHGYRFIAPVANSAPAGRETADGRGATARPSWRAFVSLGAAGTLGAGVAGLIGGIIYGAILAAEQPASGIGATSAFLVLIWLTMVAAVVGGAGVSFGIAAAGFARPNWLCIAGGAAGGLIVGGTVKLLGLDAFNLLLGRSPGDITGAFEGFLLGGAVGLGAWLARRYAPTATARGIALAMIGGAAGGVAVVLSGGKLMAGSLDLLSRSFPGSRIDLGHLGGLVGESGFGPVAQLATGAAEGALFAGCIVAAMRLARRDPDAGI